MPKKVLIVDDEMVMRSLITIAMQRIGCVVIDFDNPNMALDFLDTTTPDLIILDILMPGINGLELCRRIRARPATHKTPIIIFSALGDENTIKQAAAVGADRFLHKLRLFSELTMLVQDMLFEPGNKPLQTKAKGGLRNRQLNPPAYDKPAV